MRPIKLSVLLLPNTRFCAHFLQLNIIFCHAEHQLSFVKYTCIESSKASIGYSIDAYRAEALVAAPHGSVAVRGRGAQARPPRESCEIKPTAIVFHASSHVIMILF